MRGLEREFRLFDTFAHCYYPATAHSSNEPTTQLWVWGAHKSSGSTENGSETLSWVPVTFGYICPGPGGLQERHLVIRGRGKPAWVSAATFYRRYNGVHPNSTNPKSRDHDAVEEV